VAAKSKTLAAAHKKHLSRSVTRCAYAITKLDNEMRRIFISCVLILIASSASAGEKHSLNDTCQWKTRGIVAAAPCMIKAFNNGAAENVRRGYVRVAMTERNAALRIETIADKLRNGKINEQQAVEEFNLFMAQKSKQVDLAEIEDDKEMDAERRRQAAILYYSTRPRVDYGQQLMNTWSLQGAMHPNCSRWGVC